jgi:hypothetical protein
VSYEIRRYSWISSSPPCDTLGFGAAFGSNRVEPSLEGGET